MIKINGSQIVDGEKDNIELLTTGDFYQKDGNYYISYDEPEENGMEQTKTTIEVINESKITMTRTGEFNSQLIVENQVRHNCFYETGMGNLVVGIWGNSISSTLNDNGGDLSFKYTMDVNTALASENQVTINIREC